MSIVVVLGIMLCFINLTSSCTGNTRAKKWGGTEYIQVEKGQKVLNVTWKDNNQLWILTESMDKDYTPKTLKFQEKSNWGIIQGTIILQENK